MTTVELSPGSGYSPNDHQPLSTLVPKPNATAKVTGLPDKRGKVMSKPRKTMKEAFFKASNGRGPL